MFRRYALFLRYICLCEHSDCEDREYQEGPRYVTTIHALNSSIVKLSRCQHLNVLPVVYRGLSLDPPGKDGRPRLLQGVEPCVLAFSEDLTIAKRYAHGGLILEFQHDRARGASIKWVSQFPHEKEVLFSALSYVESVGEPHSIVSGVSFWTVRVLEFGEYRTLEDIATDLG